MPAESIRNKVEIPVKIRLDFIGIFILFVPYAKLAAQASTHSESTSSIDSNIVVYLRYLCVTSL